MNHEASRYAVWGSRRLHLAGAEELDHRSREISRAAERILSRAADRFLGRRLEEVLYRSETVSRLRRAIDHYTAVGFRGRNAIVGAEVQDAQNLPDPAGKSSGRSRVRTSVRLRVDLHPKVLLKTEIGTLRARVELPLSSSEYRLSVRRPLSSRVTSELFAAYPRGDDGHPRAGLHFFLRF